MRTVEVNRIHDPRGTLSALQDQCPFKIKRIYWLYDIPGGETQRGGHANKKCHRVIFALSGSFTVWMQESALAYPSRVILSKPWVGVEVKPMTWLELKDFSGGAVALVVASTEYDHKDYIRDKDAWFKQTFPAD